MCFQLKKKVKNDKSKKKGTKGAQTYKTTRGVVYVSHLPHGFYENEMMEYFKQFGKVTRVRVARSNKTARSKGYAFVEFEIPEVAEIAAQAMNNYIMFNQVLKTEYIPPQEQKYNLFRTGVRKIERNGETVFLTPHAKQIKKSIGIHNRFKNSEEVEKSEKKYEEKIKKYNKKLQALGINGSLNEVLHTVDNSKTVNSNKIELTKSKKTKKNQTNLSSEPETLKENKNLINVDSEVTHKNNNMNKKDKKKILKPKNIINSNEKVQNKMKSISNDETTIKEKKKTIKTKKNLVKIVSSEDEKSPVNQKKTSKLPNQIVSVEDRQTAVLKKKKQFGGIEKKVKKNDNKIVKNNKMKFAAAALMQNAEAKNKIIKTAVDMKKKGKKKV